MSLSRRANPIWLFVDLTGNILDDTYYISFLQNTIPYLPQPVFMSATGNGLDPWANPLQFYPNGTLPDNLYFVDGEVYRLEIRQGDASAPSSADPLIYLIENFTDGQDIIPPPIGAQLTTANQITNPQFESVLFNGTTTIVNTGTNSYAIAPGWFLDIASSGSSSVTLTQVPIAGIDNVAPNGLTNPGYALEVTVNSGTISALSLRQRFSNMGALWAGQFVSVTFTAKMDSGFSTVNVYYQPSTTTDIPDEYLLATATVTPVYQEFFGSDLIPVSTNTDLGAAAFVDIIFSLPVTGSIFLTNIQIIASATGGSFQYIQTTYESQIDSTFHYYTNSLINQPKDNILVGWTFPLNPWQSIPTALTNLSGNGYTADQTIIVQQNYVNSAVGNNVASSKATFSNNYNFTITPITATNRFAMIQYIDPTTARPYWSKTLSAMIRASIITSHSSIVNFKVRLIYRASLPSTISQTEPISAWDPADNSEPVLAAGWTAIKPLNDPIYTLANGSVGFAFDQFILPASTNDNMTLGIMLFTLTNGSQTATADQILFDRVSLVLNDFAIDANPETFDESLRKCQYYYEKSYVLGTLPGTAAQTSGLQNYSLPVGNDATTTTAYLKRIFLKYKQIKCMSTPTITLYAYDGTISSFSVGMNNNIGAGILGITTVVGTQLTLESISNDCANYSPNGTSAAYFNDGGASVKFYEGIIQFHYTINSRLGQ